MAGVWIFVVVVLLRWIQLTSCSCQPGKFGESCSYSCHCGTSCDETTGACSGSCDRGWRKEGGLCQKRNIALSKTTSTTPEAYPAWPASNAVDGDSDTGGKGRTCFHAGGSPSDWTVDLGRDFQLYDIRIYSRRNFYLRNANSNIYLDNDPSSICSTLPSPSNTPNPTDVTCNGTGRYVTIRNPGNGGDAGYDSALNICEVEIYVCSTGVYGVNCDKFCHCLDSTCDRWTGLCPGDCRPGWQGQRCDTACNSTTYGINCNEICAGRKCSASNSSCDRHTGACDTGCLPGWMEVNCTQECTNGKYGANCTSLCSDRHCAGNSSCDHVTGSCDSGCKAGWMGVDCKEECDSKHYGSNCLKICSTRNCDGNSSCNSTGTCDSGCLTGWMYPDCTECDSQHYGNKCNMSCSSRHCMKNSSCNATGICVGGCEAGWTGDDCAEKVATQTPSQQPEDASFPIAAVVGAVVGVVVILLLVLAVILIRRRRGKSHGRSAHKTVFADNVKPTQAEDIGMYMNIGFDNDEKPTLSPEKTSAKQMKAHRKTESQGNSTGDLDLQKVEEEEDYDVSEQPAQVEDTPEVPDRNYYNLDDNGRDHVIPVSELQKKVDEMTPASTEEEYKRLPDGYVHSYDESQQPKNKGNNRFRGYYPYDYNRVVLHRVSDDKEGDYINASYLDGYKAEKRYIAAQGPYRPEVVVDFWRMIFQEQSTTIVMVTGLVEAGKMKCLQYWPEKGTSIYGDISVTKETETQLANYTVTKLSVHNKSEGKIHHVHHFHFTSWPDHGVPDTSALLEFMWRVRVTTRHQTQPIIVHCSAGIGRTGTYIAIESLVDQAAAEGNVDVVSFVSSMRGQRKNMIQTKEQYLFLYQAVAMAVTEGDTSLDADAIRQIDLSHVPSLTMGNKNVQEHLDALGNTSETGLPGDHITTVASYTSRKGFFITTSQPDKEELWNQMYNSDSRTLITLAVENQIFLPSMDSPVSTSKLTASLQTSKVISNDVILNIIDLTVNDADVTSTIQHYHMTGSTHDPSVTLLIDSLLTWMSDPQRCSCTIMSHSVSEARFLVLLVNIASRLQDDSRVDVISNMRRLHSTLGGPQFSQEDVRQCLEFAQGRLESLGLYANL
ncbi:uncharacterized protein LOC124274485 isoform X2 [Haliotis rubra]|uniref:uncharacterized protein LOC124274485 isoform X2 n=1 Tax=Haliotis rubra TaxID=36100 RepID=UPI001EE5E783|nr:uncharacterized protein LOC124274485 isoform X2 [Haliotis rubra]